MKNYIFFFLFIVSLLKAGDAIVPGDETYYIKDLEAQNIQMIYTKQNRYAAQEAIQVEPEIQDKYEKSFGYRMDQTLYVGIISQRNQIANGFSTQYPLNMQINYIGGTQLIDHFTSTSWLDTLLYHETAHNYQVNAKASRVSRGLSTVFGNNPVPLIPLPLFVLPNIMITSNLLEGNAVLNESWHDNGGRLYSGRFRAETLLQAKAGHITPQFLYNQTTHEFPYYDRHYIVGGFFQLYLAKKYGLDKTNSFFYNYSKSWLWPFRVNHIFEMTFGESYESALKGYEQSLLAEAEGFNEAKGELIASSMYFSALNSNCDKIFFLTSDAQHAPELVRLFKKDKRVARQRESFLRGKVLNIHDTYATQGSNFTNPTMITQGLFDEDAELVEGSEGKMLQGYLKDGVGVYFDVASSFEEAQLYVGDSFYAKVNSSVYIDEDDNLYYFVQEGKKRTLFKNKTALYTLNDYYGFVSDVDAQGNIYFIANSDKGSSLYRLSEGVVTRVSQADNIVEAKIINEDELLIAAISDKAYYYVIAKMESLDETPHSRRLFFEDKVYFGNSDMLRAQENNATNLVDLEEPFIEPLDLHYAGASLSLGLGQHQGNNVLVYAVAANFADPLLSNSFSVYASQGVDRVGIVGAGYRNNAHLLSFGLNVYGVYNSGDPSSYNAYDATTNTYYSDQNITQDSRDYGLSAFAKLPVIASGYNKVDLNVDYYQDYDANARSPLVGSLNLSHAEFYGQAVDYDYFNALSLYGGMDRGDLSAGFDYKLSHGLPWKMFAGMALQGTRTDYDRVLSITPVDADVTRGVKFTPFQSFLFADRSTIVMPTLEATRYVKQAAVAEASLKKQFDGRLLFFTFPFSLTREVVYTKYRYYDVQDFGQSNAFDTHTKYNEVTAGLTLEILILNKLSLPFSFEYIHNDNTTSEHNFRFLFGASF